ncbi:GreA/GreB family elongation factor [Paenibacillus lutrae]|uniref:Transcription elongation factor GreAB n=1 Tax=Paenibacillus lutrae TaxID=2078573 RepID=A0A7X3JXI9_9BACL|nr:GreA/GreB family elongation factor [Paenibacillus lutrae]MVO98072.1 transcription elongation factor GreAB [Paenibacillus lutrae]
MNHSLLGARTQLIQQLVYFDEELTTFLEAYTPNQSKIRSTTRQHLMDYCLELTRLMQEFKEEILHSRVLIGSRVLVRYMDDQETDSYTIVFPSKADPNINYISFLSPIGSCLLLGDVGKVCSIETPSGISVMKIEKIEFRNAGDR